MQPHLGIRKRFIRSLLRYLYLATAEKVTIGEMELPYSPLRDSFDSYTQDSWTYDGRLVSVIMNDL